MGWKTGVQFPARTRIIFSCCHAQTTLGLNEILAALKLERRNHEDNASSPSIAKVRNQ
jgi:hypothetical protein